MSLRDGSIGRTSFVERFGLWNAEQKEQAAQALARIQEKDIEVVRLCFVDQHGLLRGKTIVAEEFDLVMRNGCAITTTLLAKDTAHKTVLPVFTAGAGLGMREMEGAGDFIMVPDPGTFKVLPWAPDTGLFLCDIYFQNGAPVPFSTRQIMRNALKRLADSGYDYVSGLEVEFYVFKLLDPKLEPEHATWPAAPPEVNFLAHGFNYLTDMRMDEIDPVVQLLRRNLKPLGLPIRTVESELGPSQFEFTFDPGVGLESADTMALFRNSVKQICRRHGYHATFMCR
ncbi:MAG: glutamine synthetase, partial [Alphaproteobacteria bacterium]